MEKAHLWKTAKIRNSMTNSSSSLARPLKCVTVPGYLSGQSAGADDVADAVSGHDDDWMIYFRVFLDHISSVILHTPL